MFRLSNEHILTILEVSQNYSSVCIMKIRVNMHDTDPRYLKNLGYLIYIPVKYIIYIKHV